MLQLKPLTKGITGVIPATTHHHQHGMAPEIIPGFIRPIPVFQKTPVKIATIRTALKDIPV